MRRSIVTVVLIVVGALAGQATSASAASMYWGARIDGDAYGSPTDAPWNQQVWSNFEWHTRKETTFVNMGSHWGGFDNSAFRAMRDRGVIPLLTMGLEGATLADVAAGNQDALIKAWAKKAKGYGLPFLFRPWWEMNGDWYAWGRNPDFVAAWRHFHDLVVAEGATNVTWTWVVNGLWDDPASDPGPYYPGDAYVDWVGLDAYNWGENPIQPDSWKSPDEVLTPTINRLMEIAPSKPICVCEVASTEIGGSKSSWISTLLRDYLPYHPEIKAFLWFNWNVEDRGERWDWQVESSAAAEHAFRKGIYRRIYRSTLPALRWRAKVPLP